MVQRMKEEEGDMNKERESNIHMAFFMDVLTCILF
jgi:hypothetical protein